MDTPPLLPFYLIGSGFCGSVWATAEEQSSYVLKREDGGPGRSLANDRDMHKRILSSLDLLDRTDSEPSFPRVLVPHYIQYIGPANCLWWCKNLRRFPPGFSPCNVLESERIPPLPQLIRERLIDEYCPMPVRDHVKASDSNKCCLVRPYLGRRIHQADRLRRWDTFSLKNFPLYLDQMEELRLDVRSYAKTMADALAMMHWHTQIDANDVEFVLASPRNADLLPISVKPENLRPPFLGKHAMWMLDFECCRSISMDERGVKQAVAAFFRNDPFYPRPGADGSHDQELWLFFKLRYLQTSYFILLDNPERVSLPHAFLEKIEEQRRRQWRR